MAFPTRNRFMNIYVHRNHPIIKRQLGEIKQPIKSDTESFVMNKPFCRHTYPMTAMKTTTICITHNKLLFLIYFSY